MTVSDPHRASADAGDRIPAPQVGAATRAEWAEIAAGDPGAVAEQFPAWTAAICDASSFVDRSRLYRFADGRRFVLPLVGRRGVPTRLASLWSFPNAWGIGGPVGAGLDRAAVDHIVADLHALGAARISIRVEATHDAAWAHLADDRRVIVVPRTTHVATLDVAPDDHLARLPSMTRRAVARARRDGREVRIGRGGDLLDDHYSLFLLSLQRWADKQHEPSRLALWRGQRRDPLSKLRLIGKHLGDDFCVVVGYVDGQPAASAIVLLGPVARYTRGALDVDLAGRTGINDLVHWSAIELAMHHGASTYNMGESGSSSGLSAFKERFGAVAVHSGEYRIEHLPITAVDRAARGAVKKLIRFED